MNDGELEERLRTTFRAVAERDSLAPLAPRGGGSSRRGRVLSVAAGALAIVVVAGAVVLVVTFGPRSNSGVSNKAANGAPATTAPTAATSTTTTTGTSALPTVTIKGWTGREPAAIYFSGDAGDIATGLTWSRWDSTGAVGHGTRNELGCVPDCAQGTSTPYPVTITMSNPVEGKFTIIVEQTADGRGTTETFTAPDLGQGACSTSSQDSCVF